MQTGVVHLLVELNVSAAIPSFSFLGTRGYSAPFDAGRFLSCWRDPTAASTQLFQGFLSKADLRFLRDDSSDLILSSEALAATFD